VAQAQFCGAHQEKMQQCTHAPDARLLKEAQLRTASSCTLSQCSHTRGARGGEAGGARLLVGDAPCVGQVSNDTKTIAMVVLSTRAPFRQRHAAAP
jgi:hypothetical protein